MWQVIAGLAASGQSGPPVVLYAGSFQPRKRVELIVQQAARHPDARFRLAGRGETEAACRALAQQLGCHNVEFVGHLTPMELGDEMRKAYVFLFPSILEGHPQVLGQASACGLPSIAMNLYRPDYVRNGESGFLVESDAELAEKLELLLRDPNLRRSMSRAAALHALNFAWDRHRAPMAGSVRGCDRKALDPSECVEFTASLTRMRRWASAGLPGRIALRVSFLIADRMVTGSSCSWVIAACSATTV